MKIGKKKQTVKMNGWKRWRGGIVEQNPYRLFLTKVSNAVTE